MLVCMYVCQPKIVKCQFLYVFFMFFSNCRLRKNIKCQFLWSMYVCMYVRPKLTFVSLFLCFFICTFPLKKTYTFGIWDIFLQNKQFTQQRQITKHITCHYNFMLSLFSLMSLCCFSQLKPALQPRPESAHFNESKIEYRTSSGLAVPLHMTFFA